MEDTEKLGFILIGAALGVIIFYYLIKAAIQNGTESQLEEAKLQNKLLIALCKKQGVDEAVLRDAIRKTVKKDLLPDDPI